MKILEIVACSNSKFSDSIKCELSPPLLLILRKILLQNFLSRHSFQFLWVHFLWKLSAFLTATASEFLLLIRRSTSLNKYHYFYLAWEQKSYFPYTLVPKGALVSSKFYKNKNHFQHFCNFGLALTTYIQYAENKVTPKTFIGKNYYFQYFHI